jgi:hypothetical protein
MATPPPENGKKHVRVPTRDLKREFWSPHPLLSRRTRIFCRDMRKLKARHQFTTCRSSNPNTSTRSLPLLLVLYKVTWVLVLGTFPCSSLFRFVLFISSPSSHGNMDLRGGRRRWKVR